MSDIVGRLRRLCRNEAESRDYGIPQMVSAMHGAANHIERLEACLQDLMDLQNGAPLLRDEEEWNEVMGRARALLTK